jgi:hypothetical protein
MSSLDWSAIVEVFLAVAALAGAAVSLWVTSKIDDKVDAAVEKVREDEIVPLQKKIGKQHDEIADLKTQCAKQATREDVHSLAMNLEKALGEIKAIRTGMDDMRDQARTTQASVQRVNDYLLNDKARK